MKILPLGRTDRETRGKTCDANSRPSQFRERVKKKRGVIEFYIYKQR